jgi:hypothetical protein
LFRFPELGGGRWVSTAYVSIWVATQTPSEHSQSSCLPDTSRFIATTHNDVVCSEKFYELFHLWFGIAGTLFVVGVLWKPLSQLNNDWFYKRLVNQQALIRIESPSEHRP